MHIEVSGSPALHVEQMRGYAEYRVFSQFAALAHQVRTVRVVLSRSTDDRTSCAMTAELSEGGRIRSRSRGSQPTRAIDSAAERLAEATSKRLQTCSKKVTRP
jgi:ribosome-associated translation inhibitor RaiA